MYEYIFDSLYFWRFVLCVLLLWFLLCFFDRGD